MTKRPILFAVENTEEMSTETVFRSLLCGRASLGPKTQLVQNHSWSFFWTKPIRKVILTQISPEKSSLTQKLYGLNLPWVKLSNMG